MNHWVPLHETFRRFDLIVPSNGFLTHAKVGSRLGYCKFLEDGLDSILMAWMS